MKVGMDFRVAKGALLLGDKDWIEDKIDRNLTKGLADFLFKEFKSEVIDTEVNYGTAVSFSLSFHVYTKKQHIKIVKALDEAYGEGFTSELLGGK